MYNIAVIIPKEEDEDGSMIVNDDYKEILIAILGLPALSHALSSNSISNIINVKRELSDAADIALAVADYEDVTVTITEITEEPIG